MTGQPHRQWSAGLTAGPLPDDRSSNSTAGGTARAGRSFARCRPGRLWLAAAMLCCAALSLAACAGGETKAAARPSSSDNIVLAADGRIVYAVNADVGTVTKADVRSGKVLQETAVGRFPQQAALSPDGRELYVTCRDTDKIDILKTKDLSLAGTIDAGGIEPYGIVVSPDGKRLYVSNDRSGTVAVIDRAARKAESRLAVGERPRALALTADGTKLYVGLYLKAAIAVIDTTSPAVRTTIELSASPDVSDPKKSQGIPNTLEQIRIAPDGKSAWATHLLTNTDSVIAFDETVFPAVSVIDTEADRELPKQRKELFKAINVPDSLGKTTIVSNPSDIAFAPDGAKAYVLMSGSEDVVAFDLNRGGNASGIVRHVPGDWPVGMALAGDGGALYVNNGNTHDLATIRTAGDARAEARTLKLIAKDPMSKEERLGKTVFMSANSDEYPVTQQHWMSCASCHSAGETDGLTLMASKGPRNVPSNVGAMETGLLLWDGSRDDLTDYIHTVQDEMGGMLAQDAGKPMDAKLQKLFDALSVYMKDPDSMPVPRSPYRAADGELTPEAREGKALFETKGQCIACHAGQYFTDSAQATGGTGKLTTADTTHLYDVGTANPLDKTSKGDARAAYTDPRTPKQWDVPTLRGVWATAPYLHDGSAATLKDVLTTRNPEGKHGGALTDGDIDKIVAYLQQIQ